MGNYSDATLIDALMPFIFMLPAFMVAFGSYFFYRKNGYVADKIVEDRNKWLYRQVGAKRLGKKWMVASIVIAAVLLVMAGINFLVDDFAFNHFMLFVATPIMLCLSTLYFILLIVMNRKKDDEEDGVR